MTDIEYKDFANKIMHEYYKKYEKEVLSLDMHISYIGEVFYLKICEALALLDENTFPHYGADKFQKLFLHTIENEEKDESDNFGSLPPSNKTITISNFYVFCGVLFAISSHSSPEFLLQNLGVENPQEIISDINNIENIDNKKDFLDSVIKFNQNLASIIGDEKLLDFFLWGIANFLGAYFITIFKNSSAKDLLAELKMVKKLCEEYPSICEERITIYYYKFKSLFDTNSNEGFIPDDISDLLFQLYICDNNINRFTVKRLEYKYLFFHLDALFIYYYFIYKNPQYIVKLGFFLLSDNVPSPVQSAMFSTFKKDDYAALIQYEYEWWRKEKGETLSLPFPFFDGIVNLKNLNIIDFDLNNSNRINKALPSNTPPAEVSNDVIFEKLKSYLCLVHGEDVKYAGYSFKKHYLIKVIEVAHKLKNCHSVYGFACILFFSKYFNWKGRAFNQDFVSIIVDIFNIDTNLIEGKSYNFSKSKDKAMQMIKKENLETLLSDKGEANLKR